MQTQGGLGRSVALHNLGGVLCQLEFAEGLLAELASACRRAQVPQMWMMVSVCLAEGYSGLGTAERPAWPWQEP